MHNLIMSGITISSIVFDGPYQLNNWESTEGAVVYCILYKDPKNWNVAYVGESDNLDKGSISSHPKRDCWIGKAGSESNLYIAIYPLPDSVQRQRLRITAKIKLENEPPCNE